MSSKASPDTTLVFGVTYPRGTGQLPATFGHPTVDCYAMDCFGTYFTHAQTCDDVRVQSATQWTASVHFLSFFTHAQTCDDIRVQSPTQWTASVHFLHMLRPVMTFVFKVLRNGLLRYILYTCPNLC